LSDPAASTALNLEALVEQLADQIAAKLYAEQRRLLDRKALAELLGVAERTIGSMVARGELPEPLLHTAGVVRWDWDMVKKYLADRQGRKLRRGRGLRRSPGI
jgi:predicted DNA-binding transcriptional regulator AlpA